MHLIGPGIHSVYEHNLFSDPRLDVAHDVRRWRSFYESAFPSISSCESAGYSSSPVAAVSEHHVLFDLPIFERAFDVINSTAATPTTTWTTFAALLFLPRAIIANSDWNNNA